VPVLARYFEEQGFSTVVVTMMPYWSEKLGVPRTLAVEFPFGHSFGLPSHKSMQKTVLHEALTVLDETDHPGEIRESKVKWPEPFEKAYHSWHPKEPSPIIQYMRVAIRKQVINRRKNNL
jgi:hypothetical protein